MRTIEHDAEIVSLLVHTLDIQLNQHGCGYAIMLAEALAEGTTVAADTLAALRLKGAEDTLTRLAGQVRYLRETLVRPAEQARHLDAAE